MEALLNAQRQDHKAEFHNGPPEISAEEIEKTGVLGDGSFGTVYRGECRGQQVAVKVLHRQSLDEQTLKAFRKEVSIMSRIFHPNILLYMGACTVPGHLMIITELMIGGDLETLLHNKQVNISLVTRMQMARDAARGMTWLHGSNPVIIHRDLKTSNLLVGENYEIKLCDFGLSQIKPTGQNLSDGVEGAKGTPLWMAPEVMSGEEFNEKADVYSFGIVLWEILTRDEPFVQFSNYDTFRDAICNKHVRPAIPESCHPGLKKLLQACWHPMPNKRPAFPAIMASLEYIIVDAAIQDVHGRKMWKDQFLHQDSVPWPEFLRIFTEFSKYVKLTNNASEGQVIKTKCLYQLLVEGPEGSKTRADKNAVTMVAFGKFLNWFGPLATPPDRPQLIDRVVSILQLPYFHGVLSTVDAEALLTVKPSGTFLVRFSSSAPGCYTISKKDVDSSIKHQRIIHHPQQGVFYINNKGYASLDELITKEANALALTSPCLGSRYAFLFVEQQVSGYVM
eukprot:CAMPEP_0174258702 /NCGR_PEP_ID=MMETSP0439-20130205/7658_1 /TAXON_ID=0 /ORGANISM="Stereomyxa ramosa, Strain Chinc5" /LENGTH=506 /DNA_ID=CAMNT_0015342317 /DNA_START=155 /DNA_END=1675 /DNA_ORIENTATION=+